MPRESLPSKQERAHRIVEKLKAAYPEAHCELNYADPLQLLIATILSAQCTDKQVNIVTEKLFRKYRRAEDYACAPAAELEEDIKRIGLYRGKARNIQACCRALVEHHSGNVPATMQALTALNGVGRKTANVVLGNAFGINEGIVVDTHVARLSERLDFSRRTSPDKIERDLQQLVPQDEWALWSHLLIWHGRRRCYARNPDCPGCELKDLCPAGQERLRPKPPPRGRTAKPAHESNPSQ